MRKPVQHTALSGQHLPYQGCLALPKLQPDAAVRRLSGISSAQNALSAAALLSPCTESGSGVKVACRQPSRMAATLCTI